MQLFSSFHFNDDNLLICDHSWQSECIYQLIAVKYKCVINVRNKVRQSHQNIRADSDFFSWQFRTSQAILFKKRVDGTG
jgi:hypothetical protein